MNKFSSVRTQFASKGSEPSGHSLAAYDELVAGPVQEFITICAKIGGDVKSQSDLFRTAFTAQRKLIELASNHARPSDSEFGVLLKPIELAINDVVEFKDAHRKSNHFDHLSAVASSIAAIGWVNNIPTPCPYVQNQQESGQYYNNRVLREFRDKGPEHAAWTKALNNIWTHLHDYLKQHHMTGLTWNASGSPLSASSDGAPPPPVLPPMPQTENTGALGGTDSRGALFSELNRGNAVTSGLRKVTDDMKTHKNPSLRAGECLQPKGTASAKATPSATGPPKSQPSPVQELRGNKWVVENFSKKHLHITETEPKHTVYVYNCDGCTVEIKGKINSIVLDSCKKTGLVFDDLISSLDVVNCRSVQTQVLGQLCTVNVDKTDGCQIYLSPTSKEADIITAKSSEINVLIPKGDNDFDEYSIPEQFKSKFTGKGMHTTHTEAV